MRNTKLARQLRPFLHQPSAAVALGPQPGGGGDHPPATGGPGILVDGNQVVRLDPSVAGAGLEHSAGIVNLGTPADLTHTTTNAAFGTTHTHRIASLADVSGGQSSLLRSSFGDLKLLSLAASHVYTTSGNLWLSPASGNITLPNGAVLSTAAGGYTLAPAGNITLSPSGAVLLTAGINVGAHNYQSQLTGWRITHAGEADFRYLFVDEMHAKSFVADLEQALAGGQIIAKSVAVVYAPFNLPAAGVAANFVVRDLPSAPGMAVFVNGDVVRFRQFSRAGGTLSVADAWGTVTLNTGYGSGGFDSATGTQMWTFSRSTGGNAGTASGTIAADALVLDYGTEGSGQYEVNAVDGLYGVNSPYIRFTTWTGHPATGRTVAAQLGKLSGLAGIGQPGEFGLYIRGKNAGDYLLASPLQGVNLVTAGGGVKITETAGIEIAAPTTQTGSRTIKFTSGGATYGELYTLRSGFGADVYLQSRETDGARDARVQVNAYHTGSGGDALVGLNADPGPGASGQPLLFSLDARANMDGFATLLAPQFDVLSHVTIKKPNPLLRISTTATGQSASLELYEQDLFSNPSDIRKGRIIYAGGNVAGGRYFGLINDDADWLGMISDQYRWLNKAGSELMRLNSTGLGIGQSNPQEKLHVSGTVLAQKVIMAAPGAVPASSADSSGINGEIRWDTNYLYLRVASANPYWKRVALTTF